MFLIPLLFGIFLLASGIICFQVTMEEVKHKSEVWWFPLYACMLSLSGAIMSFLIVYGMLTGDSSYAFHM